MALYVVVKDHVKALHIVPFSETAENNPKLSLEPVFDNSKPCLRCVFSLELASEIHMQESKIEIEISLQVFDLCSESGVTVMCDQTITDDDHTAMLGAGDVLVTLLPSQARPRGPLQHLV
jgi:uncharacterized protein YcbX